MTISNDIFNEQLVKKEPNPKDMMKKVGIIFAAIVVLVLVFLMLPVILLPVILVEFFVVAFLLKRTNVEYEYILTNNDLDIDKIYNKVSRKKGLNIDVKRFIIVAPVNKKEYEAELSKYDKVLDYSSGIVKENTYGVMYTQDGKRLKLIIEPNEKMLKAIRMYCPSAIKK